MQQHTEINVGSLVRGTTARRSVCPQCGSRFEGRPFCRRDGQVAEPFVVGERYCVESLIGSGGMAFVFAGHHLILGKQVAVKILRPEVSEGLHATRFLREARLASQLSHENVVGILDFGHDPLLEVHFLVMECLRGERLHAAMGREGRFPWERVVAILVQLARALAAAHETGIIHRDLTTKNVMLAESSGRRDLVKLCDFGVSRTIEGDDRVTTTGQPIGTPAYMPPEQIRGDAEQTGAVDVYALGTIAYEMLTGKLPFGGTSAVAMIAEKLAHGSRSVSSAHPEIGLPRELDQFVERCLRLEPRDRPSAVDAENLLSRLTLGTGLAPLPSGTPTSLIGATVGNHEIIALIGTGGSGSVYRARHPDIGTEVAIKVLLPEVAKEVGALERFIREAQAAGAAGSEFIPRYFDFGRLPDGRSYAVMEFCDGETLGARIARRGALPLDECRLILDQVARALTAAHRAGIIHRDIKPENILILHDAGGATKVRILDFGIAKYEAPGDAKLTAVGTFMGTPVYCAPEQIFGDPPSPATDVYALGATAFEMVTGQDAFEANDLRRLFKLKSQGVVPSPRDRDPRVPACVDSTVKRALAFLAEERFNTMEAFRASVESWDLPEAVSADAHTQRQECVTSRPARPRGLLASLALGLSGVALWFCLSWAPQEALGRAEGKVIQTSSIQSIAPRPTDRPVAVGEGPEEAPGALGPGDSRETSNLVGGRDSVVVPPNSTASTAGASPASPRAGRRRLPRGADTEVASALQEVQRVAPVLEETAAPPPTRPRPNPAVMIADPFAE